MHCVDLGESFPTRVLWVCTLLLRLFVQIFIFQSLPMSLFSISFRTDSYSNEYLLAKIDVDTAENEPLEVWEKIQFIIHSPPWKRAIGPKLIPSLARRRLDRCSFGCTAWESKGTQSSSGAASPSGRPPARSSARRSQPEAQWGPDKLP